MNIQVGQKIILKSRMSHLTQGKREGIVTSLGDPGTFYIKFEGNESSLKIYDDEILVNEREPAPHGFKEGDQIKYAGSNGIVLSREEYQQLFMEQTGTVNQEMEKTSFPLLWKSLETDNLHWSYSNEEGLKWIRENIELVASSEEIAKTKKASIPTGVGKPLHSSYYCEIGECGKDQCSCRCGCAAKHQEVLAIGSNFLLVKKTLKSKKYLGNRESRAEIECKIPGCNQMAAWSALSQTSICPVHGANRGAQVCGHSVTERVSRYSPIVGWKMTCRLCNDIDLDIDE